jgi:3-methyladenine DNA glycosylase AlkD
MDPRALKPGAPAVTARTRGAAKAAKKVAAGEVIATLKRLATKKTRDGMARYGIPSDNALGVTMGDMQKLAKRLGRSHELALELWKSGVYEARMLASLVDEPEHVTPAQMDRWCKDFDSWAICDTVCFKLFDQSPHAFSRVAKWARSNAEFEKRGAFALLACLALHDRTAGDEFFARCLPLIERASTDERNFVKKGVSWALRGIGRRSFALNQVSVALARRLADSQDAAPRWIGKDALRELTRASIVQRLRARAAK